jgi:hypothetical protein
MLVVIIVAGVTTGSAPSISVPVVTIAEHMPKHPADHPILLLHALGIAAQVIYLPRQGSGKLINAQNFPVYGGLGDMCMTVWRFNPRIAQFD